jgi:hypothetical protein
MARDRKDRSGNWIIERHGDSLLRMARITNFVSWQPAHSVLTFPKQIPDGLLDVFFPGKAKPDPFLIEIESYPDAETIEQVRRDLAMVLLTRGVVPDIILLVLRPKGKQPNQLVSSAHGLTEFSLKIHVIHLWQVPAEELLATKDVGLIPWVPLAQFDGPAERLLERCRGTHRATGVTGREGKSVGCHSRYGRGAL